MADRHVIENAVFEISFANKEEAFEQQSTLNEFVSRRLLALVERVFDELSESGVVCRIEELEIDLGQVPYHGYQGELEARLEERLKAALRSRMASTAESPGENGLEEAGYGMRREEADLQQVEYFLKHGSLPWNSVLGPGLTIDDLVETVVRTNGPELAEFLRRSMGDRAVVRRVSGQFSDDMIAEIASLLAPSFSGTLRGVFDDLIRIWSEKNGGAAPTKVTRRLVWEKIIAELLTSGTTPFTKDALISRAAQNLTVPEDVQDEVIGGSPGPISDGPGIPGPSLSASTVAGAAGASAPGGESTTSELSGTAALEIDTMRRRLAAAFLSGDAQALERIWPALLREQPSLLVEAARHYLRSARIRKNIVDAFPESILGDLLKLLSPGLTGVAADVVRESADLVESLLMAAGQSLPGQGDIVQLAWDHAFAHVVAQEESAGIDLEVYIGSLLQKTAEDHGVSDYGNFLDGLAESLKSSDRDGSPESSLKYAVQELARHAVDGQIVPQDSEGPALEVLRSYDLYGLLTARLLNTGDSSQNIEANVPLTEIIDELTRAYPWQIQKLLREFQSGAISASDAAAALAPEDLGHLIQAMLSVAERVEERGYSDLMRAVEAYAGQVDDLRRYYHRVLDYLAQGQLVDFAAIAEADRAPSGPSPAPYIAEDSQMPPPTADGGEVIERPRAVEAPPDPGEDQPEMPPAVVVDDLAQTRRDKSQGLIRELRTGRLSASDAAVSLDLPELTSLVRTFLTVSSTSKEGAPLELLQAIEAHETKAADPRRYYQRILEHALDGRPIDPERIAASTRPMEGSTEPGGPDLLPNDGESVSESLVRAYDLYQRLRDRLIQAPAQTEDSSEGGGALISLVDELLRLHPEQLRELFREFQTSRTNVSQVSARLSTEELKCLVMAFLTVNVQPGAGVPREFAQAIETYAERVADTHWYYSKLLDHVIEDRVIDLEALAASGTALPDAGEVEQAAGPQISASEPHREAASMAESETIQVLSEYLRGGTDFDRDAAARLVRSIEVLLSARSGPLRRLLERGLDSREAASRLIDLLPDRLLTRVLHLARPSEHHRIQRTADILADGLHAEELDLAPERVRNLKWQFIFQYIFEKGFAFQENVFVRDFVEFVSGQAGLPGFEELRGILGQQLTLNILPSTRFLQLQILRALTRDARRTGDARARDGSYSHASEAVGPVGRHDEDVRTESVEETPPGDIYIANAGLVLAAPYFQRLFELLELTNGGSFKNDGAAERAVHLLQFMVDGSTNSPEHLLALNKILCGVRLGLPVVRDIDITEPEKEAVEGLIQGIVQNWKALGNTSAAGFRESFLQRDGRLRLDDNSWHLLVDPRPFDMLIDQIPWGFTTIRLPWMERVVYVDWR